MRVHGQGRQTMAWAFEQRGRRLILAGDVYPESLFLRGVEQQTGVSCALQPRGAGKTFPIENVRRGPCSQPLGLARAMEDCGKGARGAVAGRNHQAALAQPCVAINSRQ